MNESLSKERLIYLRRQKRKRLIIIFSRIALLILLIGMWELLAQLKIINPFITSSPSRVAACFLRLIKDGSLFLHLLTSVYETLAGFLIGTVLGLAIAVILWLSDYVCKVLEPYLVILNALPKVALGPVIIVWAGAGTGSIIIMTLAISLIVTTLEVLNAFLSTDRQKVLLLKTMGATKRQILQKCILPSNLKSIISSMKVNIGLSWVGVIMGEFLVSKAGLGYLITYGSQVFQMDLVMTSVILLAICATAMYELINLSEKLILKKVRL